MECKGMDNLVIGIDSLGTSAIKLSEALSNFAKALSLSDEFKIAMGNLYSHGGKYCVRKAYKKSRFKKMYKRIYEKKLRKKK